MKLIKRDTDYAVRALAFFAGQKSRIISVPELVKETKIPRPFLRKILQVLNKEGILKSHKGSGGGFVLAVPPDKVYLVDLIRIFQGQLKLNECFFKKKPCPNKGICVLRRKINDIEKYVVSELMPISIAELLKN